MTQRMSAAEFRARHGAPPAPGDVVPSQSSSRASAGRRAHEAGSAMEAALGQLHDIYRAQGRADIRRRPHETRTVRVGGEVRVVNAEKTGADFAGVLRGGRAVSMEAKSIDEGGKRGAVLSGINSWPVAELDELRSVAALGGVAVVVVDVRRGEYAGRYVVPVTGADWNPDNEPVALTGPSAWGVFEVAGGADWLAVLEIEHMGMSGRVWPWMFGGTGR